MEIGPLTSIFSQFYVYRWYELPNFCTGDAYVFKLTLGAIHKGLTADPGEGGSAESGRSIVIRV